MDKEIKKIADEHWEWVEGLFNALPDGSVFDVATMEYLYKTAFAHGAKHAQQLQRLAKEKEGA